MVVADAAWTGSGNPAADPAGGLHIKRWLGRRDAQERPVRVPSRFTVRQNGAPGAVTRSCHGVHKCHPTPARRPPVDGSDDDELRLLEVQVNAQEDERPQQHGKNCRKDRHQCIEVCQVRMTRCHDQADDEVYDANDGRKPGSSSVHHGSRSPPLRRTGPGQLICMLRLRLWPE